MFPSVLSKWWLSANTRDELSAVIARMLKSLRPSAALSAGCSWQSERALHDEAQITPLLDAVYAGAANLHDPREQASVMRAPVRGLTADNTDQVVVRVEAGSLLLFPAWLRHSVSENSGVTERVSVSFNLMFDDYARQLSNPLW